MRSWEVAEQVASWNRQGGDPRSDTSIPLAIGTTVPAREELRFAHR